MESQKLRDIKRFCFVFKYNKSVYLPLSIGVGETFSHPPVTFAHHTVDGRPRSITIPVTMSSNRHGTSVLLQV